MRASTLTAAGLVLTLLASIPAAALPGPGLNGETTERIPVLGRLFPEALQTNDYIGYFEAIPSLEKLNGTYPDRVEFLRVGKSLGWRNMGSGPREPHDVLAFEITNEKSNVPFADKIHLVFTCSIHGNEKGGREGCLRVAEDFAKGIGLAAERPNLVPLLDYMVLGFVIPNTDGWTHDEPQYIRDGGSSMYTRGNANGTDLNRQWPTLGYLEATRNHRTMAEPEIGAVAAFLKQRYTNVHYAVDIHGMLTPADATSAPPQPSANIAFATEFQRWLQKPNKGHFLLGLLSSAQLTQDDFIRQTRMAELIREKTANCPGTLGPTWCMAPSTGAWGGAYNFWGTSWETIGYTSSGSTSNFMTSPFGLDAPAATYEMSYNHMVCDGVYTGCGAYMNEFHVNNVRRMVEALMEAARTDFRVSLESGGARTAYLYNPKVLQLDPGPSGGWADENPLDDGWDRLHNRFTASPMDYLANLADHVRNGEQPGVFDKLGLSDMRADTLKRYDQLIIAGSSSSQLADTHVTALNTWVQEGGRLVLTDQSMDVMERLGAVTGGTVKRVEQYVGRTEIVDYTHPFAKNLLGYSRQTYDPISLGIPAGQAPVWTVESGQVTGKGKIVGVIPQGGAPANFGELTHGKGSIRFLGALLPDPTLEHYAPYGVGSYGVTYAGNQFFVNTLGFELVFKSPPLVLEDVANLRKKQAEAEAAQEPGAAKTAQPDSTPGAGLLAALIAVGLAFAVLRKRT